MDVRIDVKMDGAVGEGRRGHEIKMRYVRIRTMYGAVLCNMTMVQFCYGT